MLRLPNLILLKFPKFLGGCWDTAGDPRPSHQSPVVVAYNTSLLWVGKLG